MWRIVHYFSAMLVYFDRTWGGGGGWNALLDQIVTFSNAFGIFILLILVAGCYLY